MIWLEEHLVFKKEKVDSFKIMEGYLIIHCKEENSLHIYPLKNLSQSIVIKEEIDDCQILKNKIFIQKRNSIYIYNEEGILLKIVNRFSLLKNSHVDKNILIVPTFDQIINKKRYITEINLEALDTEEWEWNYKDAEAIKGVYNYNLIVFFEDLIKRKKHLQCIEKKTSKIIWSVLLDDLNPKYNKDELRLNLKIEEGKIIFKIGDVLNCLNAQDGKVLWQVSDLGKLDQMGVFIKNKKIYCIPFKYYDYTIIDIQTGNIEYRIKNWEAYKHWYFENSSYTYPQHWRKKIKVYDNIFLISTPKENRSDICFFDLNTTELIYRAYLPKAVNWDDKNFEYYEDKLFAKIAEEYDAPYTLKVFNIELEIQKK